MTDVEGGLDEPEELQPEPGALALASEGDEWSRSDWEQAASAVLRKAGRLGDADPDDAVWSVLAHTTYDGIAITPLGTPDLLEGLVTSGRPTRPGAWDIRAFSADGDAALLNREALADLQGGATSLWLGVDSGTDFRTLLAGVELPLAAVVLRARDDQIATARAFLDAADGALHPDSNLGVDAASATEESARLAADAGVLGFVVDAAEIHAQGASEAQELGWAMAEGARYLRAMTDAGFTVDRSAGLVEFRFAATDEQFTTISKLRAARRLWARVLELCKAEPVAMRLHAVTGKPMMTTFDPWVNMLRTMVAAFAAGVGGADAVTVLPFDSVLGRPDAFGRRIARNVSSLLVSEAHAATVADPAGGAYAVEKLTDDLAVAAWKELGRLEDDGPDAFAERVREVADRRREHVATRRAPITGVSEFPHLGEQLPERPAYDEFAGVARYAEEFERLRLDPPSGHVFLATLGSLAAHSTRAGFATNLFAAGGIAVDVAGATDGVDDLVAAYAGQAVVCVAGADAAYAEWGVAAAAALREAGARTVVVVSTGSTGEAWADGAFSSGDDAVDFLTRIREHLS